MSFGSKIVGGVFAAVSGATLSAPVVAMIIGRVRDYEAEHEADVLSDWPSRAWEMM